eukprot:CAMPEP_0197196008 /NCGR_PEP_ID=MMETSP1423-20130617/32123_1 /TAXON_ID=476441 /ORGANISM="Pseudo-nitzschia heimii, Strain UNC1101" /LENGTH=152 /DNA_ID=CAMNT_0042649771 /DNA_START=656 /DNA_END=1110 /DNA_ORIENTATION=+
MPQKSMEERIRKAAVIYNTLKLLPTVLSASIYLAMLCSRSFSLEECNDRTIQKRVLREANHGQRWHAIGATHSSSNEFFIVATVKDKRETRAALLKEKASRLAAEKLEKEALAILESLDGDAEKKKKLKVVELQKLMSFYGVERKKQAKTAA